MVKIESNQVYSDAGKMLHRIGDNAYFTRCFPLPGDTAEMFEEVDDVPEDTEDTYEERVNAMIRQKYSLSEELAILRQRDTKPDEFNEYFAYAEQCKEACR